MKKNIAALTVFLFVSLLSKHEVFAQQKKNQQQAISIRTDDHNYDQLKATGQLVNRTILSPLDKSVMTYHMEANTMRASGPPTVTSAADCDCWIPTDGSFSVAPICQGTCLPPDYRNDDGSSAAIVLPFNFCLNGTTESTVYINNNGNVSFGASYGTFTSSGFPSATYKMIAPFWADVDTRNPASGLVYYKITPTYMIVQWDNVGYYNSMVDLLNTFQLIISDGSDPIIPGGKNVAFCYKDMQWTTGAASSGVGGFGGTPATVGVNFGDGINYIQMGRFDQPGAAYDGPFGASDGVDWLDNQHFDFDWCTSTNIAPVLSNPNFCDTITVCVGATINPTLTFLSPETGQTTTTNITSTLPATSWTVLSNTPGNSNFVSVQITAMPGDVGYQTMTFTATDDGVPSPASTIFSILVHVLASPTVNAGNDTSFCSIPVQLNATGSAGVITYSWSPATGLSDPNIANPFASPVVNTDYIVTVSNGTCTAQDTVTVIGGVTNATASAPVNICQGSNTQLTSSGGAIFSWSPATGLSSSTISNPVATPATTTTYTVTVSNGPGCTATASTTVTVSPAIAPAISSFTDVTCAGLSNGTATVSVSGGTGPFSYSWSPSGGTTPTATGLAGGLYTVTVTDAFTCTQTTSININEPLALTVTPAGTTDVLCFGDGNGSASVNVSNGTPGYTYSWSPSGGTTATASGLSGGTYTVTVTDLNGCTQTLSAIVNEPLAALTATIPVTAAVTCNGAANGSATVNANGGTVGAGYTYSWSPTGGTNALASGLSGGTYTVTVTDANGCIQTATTVVDEPSLLVVTPGPTTDVLCFGDGNGSVSANAVGGTPGTGYTYSWSPSGGTNATATGLSGGTYTVTVTDANGCIQTSSSTVNEPLSPLVANISSETDVMCNGGNNGSASVGTNGGGTGTYNYAWLPFGGSNATANNLTQGNYTVTVTDANGCTSLANVTINEPTAVTLAVSPDDTICIGQSSYISAIGGGGVPSLTYAWDNGVGTFDQTVSPTTTTIYSVTVTDANGCSPASQSITITVNPPLSVVANATPSICFGSSANISALASGGNSGPYSYLWSNGIINPNSTVTPDHDTTLTVVINDGCSPPVQTSVNIVVNALPVAAFGPLTAGGCPPLSVSFTDSSVADPGSSCHWNFGDSFSSTSQSPSHVYSETGLYSVSLIVITPAGCSDTVSVPDVVTVLPVPTAMFSMSEPQISMYNPVISFTDLSSDAIWHSWDFGDGIGTSDSLNPVYQYSAAGLYTIQLIVQNNVGCFDTTNSILHVTNEITLYAPTGFTPNGDGINDNFQAYGIGISEFTMSIYDRWGTPVFQSNNKDIPWNGLYNSKGAICPNDVYVYKITYKDVDGVSHDYVGHVALTR